MARNPTSVSVSPSDSRSQRRAHGDRGQSGPVMQTVTVNYATNATDTAYCCVAVSGNGTTYAASDAHDQRDAERLTRQEPQRNVQRRLFANNGTSISGERRPARSRPTIGGRTERDGVAGNGRSGSVITATVANGPGYPRDWAGLYATNAPDSAYVAWQYLNGTAMPPATGMPTATLQFPAPMNPGQYQGPDLCQQPDGHARRHQQPVTVQGRRSRRMPQGDQRHRRRQDLEGNGLRLLVRSTRRPTTQRVSPAQFRSPGGRWMTSASIEVQLWRNCVEAIDRPAGACSAATPGGPAELRIPGERVVSRRSALRRGDVAIRRIRRPTARDGAT